ncbi:MAG: hypothetical protein ACRDRN_00170 [Sciscionella sp.]
MTTGGSKTNRALDPRLRAVVRASRTVDTHVKEGDAKVWGTVEDVHDEALHRRYADALFTETGFDLRGQTFEHFFQTDLIGASAVAVGEGHLDVTVWREGTPERVVRKH